MKKRVTLTALTIAIMLVTTFLLTGCITSCPSPFRPPNPWHENSEISIYGFFVDSSLDGTQLNLEWSMRQSHAIEVDSFDIKIYQTAAENEQIEIYAANVKHKDSYRYTYCCGGPSM
ncbi:MAG: hypothetical protein FWD86_03640, partial [Firmicutes bacterium]|nr:hypothetical protein [Bacillota bacterium]